MQAIQHGDTTVNDYIERETLEKVKPKLMEYQNSIHAESDFHGLDNNRSEGMEKEGPALRQADESEESRSFEGRFSEKEGPSLTIIS
jgi:hypothetical protein